MFTNHIYLTYMNKPDLALNNLQWLICHKAKPNQIKKCFRLFPRRFGPIWTHKTQVPKLDYVARPSVWLLNHTWNDTIHNVQAHRLIQYNLCPVGWGCRIHRLLLCRGVRLPNECPRYDTKQSDGEVPVILELWRMRSTPLLPSLPGPLWPGVVAPDKAPIYGLNKTKPCFLHNTDFCI